MNGSSVVDLREVRETAGASAGASAGQIAGDLFAEKANILFAELGRAMASGGLRPAVMAPAATGSTAAPTQPGQPARLTEAVLGAKRTAFQVSAGSGGRALAGDGPAADDTDLPVDLPVDPPVLAFVDAQTECDLAGEAPRALPRRRRIRTGMRLDAERWRRLNLVAGFTSRSTQAVIVAALQAYLRDLVPCPAALPGNGTGSTRRQRGYSPARGTQRSLRLHPHLYWRLMIAAQRGQRSVQSILTAALDSYLDIVAPEISAEVFSCLMGWTDAAGVSTSRSKFRAAHWRAQSGRPLGRRLR